MVYSKMVMLLLLLSCFVNTELYEQQRLQLLDQDGDGWSRADGDCDDADPDISPAAEELCDNLDNDCDGLVDEDPADLSQWYLDEDGDGYGALPVEECSPFGADRTMVGGDCDDGDPSVYPEAPENWFNALRDNDCDEHLESAASSLDLDVLEMEGLEAFVPLNPFDSHLLMGFSSSADKVVLVHEDEVRQAYPFDSYSIEPLVADFRNGLMVVIAMADEHRLVYSTESDFVSLLQGDLPETQIFLPDGDVNDLQHLSDWDGDGIGEVVVTVEQNEARTAYLIENVSDTPQHLQDSSSGLLNLGTENVVVPPYDLGDLNGDGSSDIGLRIDGHIIVFYSGRGFDISFPSLTIQVEGSVRSIGDVDDDERDDVGFVRGSDAYVFTDLSQGGTVVIDDHQHHYRFSEPLVSLYGFEYGGGQGMFAQMERPDSENFLVYFSAAAHSGFEPSIGMYTNLGLQSSAPPIFLDDNDEKRVLFWDQNRESLFSGILPVH